jgi:hypothetical protein
MNHTLRRTWHTALIAISAALYAWVGLAAPGVDRVLGLTGAVLILTALALMARSRATAGALLVIGALPLAIHTWWSLITPLLALLVITLGWSAIRGSDSGGAKFVLRDRRE